MSASSPPTSTGQRARTGTRTVGLPSVIKPSPSLPTSARSLILLYALYLGAPGAGASYVFEWRSGAVCESALTYGEGLHTRLLLQLDDHAVNLFVTPRSSPPAR